jgi:HD-GYP domain-containing protein (c-di-GMP phosphodiesterase class II)
MERALDSRENDRSAGLSPNLQFLQAFNMLLHSARIHQDNNRVLIDAVQKFAGLARKFLEEDHEITLLTYNGRFYLQQEKIVYRPQIAVSIDSLLDFFSRRQMNGLRFFSGIANASASEIALFARLLIAARKEENPGLWLAGELKEKDLGWADYVPASDATFREIMDSEPSDDQDARRENSSRGEEAPPSAAAQKEDIERSHEQEAVLIYGYTMKVLRYIAGKFTGNEKAGINKALKMVHKLIDLVAEDSDILLGLSTIRDYDDYTFTHSINVAILSACLGHRIGLSRKSLETLTLSAFFHDLGKVQVPRDILNKPGRLTDSELKEMKNHSLYSVKQILFLKTTPQKKAEMILPPFEHHLKYDLTGYPQTPRKKPLSLFGRILAIADVYDALTAPRVYRPVAISPDRALGIMQEGAGRDFDPLLLKVFINMIGILPVGTLLRFADGRLGLVAKYTGSEEEGREIWVRMLQPSVQGGFTKGDLVSLGTLREVAEGESLPIAESLHPSAGNIQPADFLL